MAELTGAALVRSLTGEQLTAITFVMDYVQLCFEQVTLNCFTLPTVQIGDTTLAHGHGGWRDALCGCITQPITDSSLTDEALCLSFERVSVAISLRAEDYRGPEAFSLSRPSSPMLVV